MVVATNQLVINSDGGTLPVETKEKLSFVFEREPFVDLAKHRFVSAIDGAEECDDSSGTAGSIGSATRKE
jgi:hypothetical protein